MEINTGRYWHKKYIVHKMRVYLWMIIWICLSSMQAFAEEVPPEVFIKSEQAIFDRGQDRALFVPRLNGNLQSLKTFKGNPITRKNASSYSIRVRQDKKSQFTSRRRTFQDISSKVKNHPRPMMASTSTTDFQRR